MSLYFNVNHTPTNILLLESLMFQSLFGFFLIYFVFVQKYFHPSKFVSKYYPLLLFIILVDTFCWWYHWDPPLPDHYLPLTNKLLLFIYPTLYWSISSSKLIFCVVQADTKCIIYNIFEKYAMIVLE